MGADRNCGLLQPFARLWAERVGAGQPLTVAEKRQESLVLGICTCVGGGLRHLGQGNHGAEAGSPGPHRRRLRIGVDNSRNGLIVGLARLPENVGGDDLTLIFADVGQRPYAVDVADGPQLFRSPQMGIDRERPGRPARLRRSRGQCPERVVACPWRRAAGRRSAPGRRRSPRRSRSPSRRAAIGVRGKLQLDTVSAENIAESVTQRSRLATEHTLGHVDDHRPAAKSAHGLRHLDSDRSTAQDQQPTRNGLHRCHVTTGPDALPTRVGRVSVGRQDRPRLPGPHGRQCDARRRPRPRPALRAGQYPAEDRCRDLPAICT